MGGCRFIVGRQGRITCHESAEQHQDDSITGQEPTQAECCWCCSLLAKEREVRYL